jgi:hypothetical protein
MLPFAPFAILAAVGVTLAARLPDKIYGVNIGSWWVQFFDTGYFDVFVLIS